MEIKELIKRAGAFAKPFKVTDGGGFRLKDLDPTDTLDFGSEDKPRSKEVLALGVEALAQLQDMLRHTASKEAPWYVVPADNKWFTRLVVAAAIIDTLASLGLRYPKVTKEKLRELAAAKRGLLAGK